MTTTDAAAVETQEAGDLTVRWLRGPAGYRAEGPTTGLQIVRRSRGARISVGARWLAGTVIASSLLITVLGVLLLGARIAFLPVVVVLILLWRAAPQVAALRLDGGVLSRRGVLGTFARVADEAEVVGVGIGRRADERTLFVRTRSEGRLLVLDGLTEAEAELAADALERALRKVGRAAA